MSTQTEQSRPADRTLLAQGDRHPFVLAALVLLAAALCKVGGVLIEGAPGMVTILLVDVVALSTGVALVLGGSRRKAASALVVAGAVSLTLGNLLLTMGVLWWAYR